MLLALKIWILIFFFIHSPISLCCIREKLDPNSPQHYSNVQAFINDCRRLFNNAYLFYQVSYSPPRLKIHIVLIEFLSNILKEDSKIYQCAQSLEKFFDKQLQKFLPQYARSSTQEKTHTYNLSDLIEDEADNNQNDPDYVPGSAKRMRTSSAL
jgi:hypothetical protein